MMGHLGAYTYMFIFIFIIIQVHQDRLSHVALYNNEGIFYRATYIGMTCSYTHMYQCHKLANSNTIICMSKHAVHIRICVTITIYQHFVAVC